jgi:hypothetical protein
MDHRAGAQRGSPAILQLNCADRERRVRDHRLPGQARRAVLAGVMTGVINVYSRVTPLRARRSRLNRHQVRTPLLNQVPGRRSRPPRRGERGFLVPTRNDGRDGAVRIAAITLGVSPRSCRPGAELAAVSDQLIPPEAAMTVPPSMAATGPSLERVPMDSAASYSGPRWPPEHRKNGSSLHSPASAPTDPRRRRHRSASDWPSRPRPSAPHQSTTHQLGGAQCTCVCPPPDRPDIPVSLKGLTVPVSLRGGSPTVPELLGLAGDARVAE